MGINFKEHISHFEQQYEALQKEYDRLFTHKNYEYPAYYTLPFHSYDEGNLGWKPAMEAEPMAVIVHSTLYASNKDELDVHGDYTLRKKYHDNMKVIFQKHSFQPKRILDIGCSIGGSSLQLHDSFPEADILGMDLSPYFLSGNFYSQHLS